MLTKYVLLLNILIIFTSGNLETQLVDNVNVTALFSEATDISNYLKYELDDFQDSILQNQRSISQLSQAISDIRQKIDYFIPYQQIPLNYKAISMDVLQDNVMTWLSAGALSDVYGAGCANTTIYRGMTGQYFTTYIEVC